MTSAVPTPTMDRDPYDVEWRSVPYTARRDRVRWGPIVAGLVVAVGTYLILQLALVTAGLVDIPSEGNAAGAWSAAAAIVAFVLGGVTAGASAAWSSPTDGLLHGIVMWAVAVVALLLLAGVSSGLALGALDTSEIFDRLTTDTPTVTTGSTEEDAAGWALIGLSVALAASAVGGLIGARLWPRRDEPVLERR